MVVTKVALGQQGLDNDRRCIYTRSGLAFLLAEDVDMSTLSKAVDDTFSVVPPRERGWCYVYYDVPAGIARDVSTLSEAVDNTFPW